MKDPAEVARNWAQNLGRSTDKIRQGVARVQEAPTLAAARRQDAYVEGVQRAAQEGKWRRGLQKVTLADWQQSMLEKGLTRIAGGAQAAQGKMQEFMAEFLPYEEQLKQKIAAMPKGTLEDSKARAIAAIEHNAAFRRRR